MKNADYNNPQKLEYALEKLPGVESVNKAEVKDRLIEHVSLQHKSLGSLKVHRLKVEDSSALFNFYVHGLSEKYRNFFPPYPLFNPPLNSAKELASRIIDWQKEGDWTVLKLTKDEQIIGICLLKRYKAERPVSGLAVREEFQKKKLGLLLQTIVNEQARLLGLRKLYATLAQDNKASLQVHRKCGFKQTGKLVPHFGYKNGSKVVDRHDIEMVIEFNYG